MSYRHSVANLRIYRPFQCLKVVYMHTSEKFHIKILIYLGIAKISRLSQYSITWQNEGGNNITNNITLYDLTNIVLPHFA